MPISARFHTIRDRVLSSVDRVFAELVRLSPMNDGSSDGSRSQVQIEAVLRVGEGKVSSADGGRGEGWRTRIAAGKAELHIDRTKFPNVVARQGDRVRALSRPGEPLFEVAHVDDRSHTRLVLNLNEV